MMTRLAAALPRPRVLACLLAAALLAPAIGVAGAPPADISLSSASYATSLTVQDTLDPGDGSPPVVLYTQSKNDTSTTALASVLDRLDNDVTAHAGSQADLFGVSATTTAHGSMTVDGMVYGGAHAAGQTTLTFNTTQDTVAPLVFDFVGGGYLSGGGYATLTDLTLAQDVFHYDWYAGSTANLSLAQTLNLLASHTYGLTLYAYGDASNDSTTTAIDVSGLELTALSAPEPTSSAMVMLGLGLAAFAARRDRRAVRR